MPTSADYLRQQKALQEQLQLKKDIGEATERELDQLTRVDAAVERLTAKQKKKLADQKTSLQISKQINVETAKQVGELSSISGVYSSLVNSQKSSLKIAEQDLTNRIKQYRASESEAKIMNDTLSDVSKLNALQQSLAESGPDNVEAQNSIREQYEAQKNEILDSIKQQRAMGELTLAQAEALERIVSQQDANLSIAEQYATISAEQKELIQSQIDAYDGIKKSLRGIVGTAKQLFSGWRGFVGTSLFGAGMAADKLGANIKKFGGFVDSAQFSALGLSLIFEDAEETAASLAQQFGGLKDVSFATQLNTNLMANNMGITGDEAANVVGSFARLNNMSADTAVDMAATTKSMAKAAGVPISKVMKDVANSTEAFALYGKNGGKNIAQAAVAAAKLGVEMDSMTKVTDSLLDFETSITNELELGAMLGRNLNLDKARALAYEEDIAGAVGATLDELGGIEEFNKMDIFSKKKTAELLGISVSEFQKMAANQDKLSEGTGVVEEKWNTITEALTGFVTGPLGGALKGMGGMVIAAGQLNMGLGAVGTSIGGMAKGTVQVLKNLVSMIAPTKLLEASKAFGGAIGESKLGKGVGALKDKLMAGVGGGGVKPEIPTGGPEKASAFGKINASSLIKGAAAVAIMAGALWIFAKATQEFGDKVNWPNVFIGIGAMALLGGVAALLGLAGPMILIGAAAMLLAAGAFYVFGLASQEVAKGLAMLGPALIGFSAGMVAFVDAPYIRFGLGMAGLAVALTTFGLVSPFMLMAAVGMTALGGALALFSAALPNFVTAVGQLGGVDLSPLMSLAAMAPLFFLMALSAPGIVVLGAAFTVLSSAMVALSTSLPMVMDQISQLVSMDYQPIFGLAGAISVLAFSLLSLASAGLLALPILLGLGALGAAAGALGFGGGDKEDEKMDELIGEIKGLRADLVAGKIGVSMDGVKVTSRISGIVDKIGSNSYAKV
jgi:hypothetical protein